MKRNVISRGVREKVEYFVRREIVLSVLMFGISGAMVFADYPINTLATLNQAVGVSPEAILTISGNTLYGTTTEGGQFTSGGTVYNSSGTVFSLPIAGGTPTVVGTFGVVTNGVAIAGPQGGMVLAGGNLYGVASGTSAGGVYSVPLTGGPATKIASPIGAPNGSLLLSGNTLYGTSFYGGDYGNGTLYSVPLTGGTPTVLASFQGKNGIGSIAGVTLSGNTLYGTTWFGGANGDGMVFSVPVTGGVVTVLGSFNITNGANPRGDLLLSGNTLYGTTYFGGIGSNNTIFNGYGTVFSIPITGGAPTVLAYLDGTNGANSATGLALVGNTLYGTAENGGAHGDGTIFSVPLTGGVATTVASFSGANGISPDGQLAVLGQTLYGTTRFGGPANGGTVFSITVPEPGSLSVLAIGGVTLLRRRRNS